LGVQPGDVHSDLLCRQGMQQIFGTEQTLMRFYPRSGYCYPKYLQCGLFHTDFGRQNDEAIVELSKVEVRGKQRQQL
jgi:hypothetical protein